MKHVLAMLLCFALLLGLFAAALDRHVAMQRTRLERFFPPASGLRYQNGCCILPAPSPVVRQLLRRVLGGAYVRIVP